MFVLVFSSQVPGCVLALQVKNMDYRRGQCRRPDQAQVPEHVGGDAIGGGLGGAEGARRPRHRFERT